MIISPEQPIQRSVLQTFSSFWYIYLVLFSEDGWNLEQPDTQCVTWLILVRPEFATPLNVLVLMKQNSSHDSWFVLETLKYLHSLQEHTACTLKQLKLKYKLNRELVSLQISIFPKTTPIAISLQGTTTTVKSLCTDHFQKPGDMNDNLCPCITISNLPLQNQKWYWLSKLLRLVP